MDAINTTQADRRSVVMLVAPPMASRRDATSLLYTIQPRVVRYFCMSYTQTSYHIVLRTHRSVPSIAEEHERDLYSYILGFINNVGGKLYRIGGMPDHVHLFVSLPATLAMSKFVQELKISTSKWLKANPAFPLFDGWSKEYAGFSYSMRDKDMIVGYIAKQKEHHRHRSFVEEYRTFLEENGMTIREEYFLRD